VAAPQPPESGSEAEAPTTLNPGRSSDEGGRIFLEESCRYLTLEYPAKLERALRLLPPEDLWWRPAPATNSVGHLLRHLSGNVRQWVVHGIGGRPDARDRASEFADQGGELGPLLDDLRASLADAEAVLRHLPPGALLESRSIQGIETTVLRAVYHVVEHFSMHTGQILWIVKARTGRELGFYEVDEQGHVTGTNW